MTPFDPDAYPAPIAELWSTDRLPELGPGRPNAAVRDALQSLSVDRLFPQCRDREAALGCLGGLWLLHDFLDESHGISQDLGGWIGSYWHGIMHRREPDAGNAKYWFRRVPRNPVFEALGTYAADLGWLLEEGFHPFDFVDSCEEARGTGSEFELVCRRVQLREMQLLFDHCYRHAAAG
jgi:hypothetical protein